MKKRDLILKIDKNYQRFNLNKIKLSDLNDEIEESRWRDIRLIEFHFKLFTFNHLEKFTNEIAAFVKFIEANEISPLIVIHLHPQLDLYAEMLKVMLKDYPLKIHRVHY